MINIVNSQLYSTHSYTGTYIQSTAIIIYIIAALLLGIHSHVVLCMCSHCADGYLIWIILYISLLNVRVDGKTLECMLYN